MCVTLPSTRRPAILRGQAQIALGGGPAPGDESIRKGPPCTACTREIRPELSNLIYVHSAGEYDRARWLHLDLRSDRQVIFQLQDLCHPGRLSPLTQVACPLDFVEIALDRGTLQVTTNGGYMLIRSSGEHLTVEFRGLDDVGTHKVNVLREDVRKRLVELAEQARRVTIG